jgi:uncharacterized SAM-binding protein YcdF (DUF218 family)
MSRRLLWFLLLIIAAVALAVVLIPAMAYRMTDVQQPNPIIDSVGGVPIVIVAEGQSVRAFSRMVDGTQLIFLPSRTGHRSSTPRPAASGILRDAQSAER